MIKRLPDSPLSMTFKKILGIVLLLFLAVSAVNAQKGTFVIKGKVLAPKNQLGQISLMVINSEVLDTNYVSLSNGKFDFLLALNNTYLLLVQNGDEPLKKILISTSAPVTDNAYKMKLTIDIPGRSTHGIAEYNGFEKRFELKALRKNELKRRKHEFLTFYEYVIGDMRQ